MEIRVSIWSLTSALVGLGSVFAVQGCAVLGLTGAAAGVAVLQGGAGAIVKAGTEYTVSGVAYRTFTLSLADLHEAAHQTLHRMDIPVRKDKPHEWGIEMVATATDRTIDIRLERLTCAVTRMRLVVKKGRLRRDRATASEIIAQLELTAETAAAKSRMDTRPGPR